MRGSGAPSYVGALVTRKTTGQNSHANRDPVGHLPQDEASLRIIGNLSVDLQTSIHWAGMQDDRVRSKSAEALARQTVPSAIVVGDRPG